MELENTYVNGKTGIYVANANDSSRINGMGFIYLEHALTVYNADAFSVHDNFTIFPSTSAQDGDPDRCVLMAATTRGVFHISS